MNRVSDLLGIKYPVIQGAMAGISNSELVAAVSEAGGLGTLQTALLDEDSFEKEIEKTQELTEKPFAVNFPIARGESVQKFLDIALDKGVEILSLSAGNPKPFLDNIKKAKVTIQVIPYARLAKKMQEYDFDLIVTEGNESGGDVSTQGVSTLSLVSGAVEQCDIPVIAAGGIADEKTASSVKKLGAEGVQLGTRFLASEECNIHENAKKFIINHTEDEIFKLRHGGMASNVVKNEFVERLLEKTENGNHIEMMEKFEREKIGMYEGNAEEGIIMAGQSIGRIEEIKPVKRIVKQIGEVFS